MYDKGLIKAFRGLKKGKNALRTAPEPYSGSDFLIVYDPKMVQNGLQWPPKATLSTLESCTRSLCMISALRGLKKGQKRTQNASRTIFRVRFLLFFRPKMAQNGPKLPQKATLSTLESCTGSLCMISALRGLKKGQNRGEISSKLAPKWSKFVPSKSSRWGSWRPGTLKGTTFSTISHRYIPIPSYLGQEIAWQELPRFRGASLILSVPQCAERDASDSLD